MRTNREIVEDMFSAFEHDWSNPEIILKDMADDGEWWIAGKTPISGGRSKENTISSLRQLKDAVHSGLQITATGWTIDGDRVAVEAFSKMSFKDGREYRNEYHFLIKFVDGKMTIIKEYMDTDHLREIYLDNR